MPRMREPKFTMNVKRMLSLGAIRSCSMTIICQTKHFAYVQDVVLKHILTKLLLKSSTFFFLMIPISGCTKYSPKPNQRQDIYCLPDIYFKKPLHQLLQDNVKILSSQVGLYYFTVSLVSTKRIISRSSGFPICQHWATSTQHDQLSSQKLFNTFHVK